MELLFELHLIIPAFLHKYRNDEVIFAQRVFPDGSSVLVRCFFEKVQGFPDKGHTIYLVIN